MHCHRSVIAAKSEYFRAICDSGLTKAALDYTVTKEEDRNILDSVIKYLYLGCTDITKQNVVSLVLAADFIRHNELKKECEEYMISNINVAAIRAFCTVDCGVECIVFLYPDNTLCSTVVIVRTRSEVSILKLRVCFARRKFQFDKPTFHQKLKNLRALTRTHKL